MNDSELVKSLQKKYPYIDQFVESMTDLGLSNYIDHRDSLNTFVSFLAMYVHTCKHLKENNLPISKRNISLIMKQEFSKNHFIDYISYLNNIEFKLTDKIKND